MIDTNVPLTAAGYNRVAGDRCRANCVDFIRLVTQGDVLVVMDDAEEVLREYRKKVRPDPTGNPAERFLMYVIANRYDTTRVRQLGLARNELMQFVDYPDNAGEWRTDEPRCRTFDEDDKKWVALAVRFGLDKGHEAPIANAADRCWLAFRGHLETAGVALDFLCQPSPPLVDARA